jgi:hypothetical protein
LEVGLLLFLFHADSLGRLFGSGHNPVSYTWVLCRGIVHLQLAPLCDESSNLSLLFLQRRQKSSTATPHTTSPSAVTSSPSFAACKTQATGTRSLRLACLGWLWSCGNVCDNGLSKVPPDVAQRI